MCFTILEEIKSTNHYFTIIVQQIKSSQIKCWFLMRGENWSTRGKTSQSRVENQQTQSTYDGKGGNRTRATLVEGKCSTTRPTLPLIWATFKNTIILFVFSPKFCTSIVFIFSWDHCKSQEKMETIFMQNFGGKTKSIIVLLKMAHYFNYSLIL